MARAVVTGASSGIGAAFARRLARDGFDLVVVARRAAALEALAQELREKRGVEVEVLPADLCDPAGLARVEDLLRGDPRLDLLVNNAGFGLQGRFHESDLERQTRMLRLNVEALMRLSHAALGPMVERGHGAVVNVSSGVGLVPAPFFAVYGGSKAFVASFSEALAEELRGTGVRVQCLCPGFTRTEFQEASGTKSERIPAFAWQQPDDVVEASLAGLRRGELIVIPGLLNRVGLAFRGPLGRSAARRALGFVGRRWVD